MCVCEESFQTICNHFHSFTANTSNNKHGHTPARALKHCRFTFTPKTGKKNARHGKRDEDSRRLRSVVAWSLPLFMELFQVLSSALPACRKG